MSSHRVGKIKIIIATEKESEKNRTDVSSKTKQNGKENNSTKLFDLLSFLLLFFFYKKSEG